MKKILVFSQRPHTLIGGIEAYAINLFHAFSENPNYEIHETYFNNDTFDAVVSEKLAFTKSQNFFEMHNLKAEAKFFPSSTKNEKRVIRLLKKVDFVEYDMIIFQNYRFFKMSKKLNLKKAVFVQHLTYDFYEDFCNQNAIIKTIIKLWFTHPYSNKYNFFKFSNNVVVFDKANEEYINKKLNLDKKFYQIAIPYSGKILNSSEIIYSKKTNILYSGRIDNFQKNISFLIKAANFFVAPLTIYGFGKKIKRFKWHSNINYEGFYNKDQLLDILSKVKVFVMTSKFEGFPFALVEALSNGIPIVVLETYPSAKFLTNNNKNGILVPASASPEEFAAAVNKIYNLSDNEYQQMSQNCLEFAQQNLSFKKFKTTWTQVAKNILGE
ncbi:glycosyltransferase [Candidatus Mycoplasma pogonae]